MWAGCTGKLMFGGDPGHRFVPFRSLLVYWCRLALFVLNIISLYFMQLGNKFTKLEHVGLHFRNPCSFWAFLVNEQMPGAVGRLVYI